MITFDEIKEYIKDVQGTVEANDFEKLMIWTDYKEDWKETSLGYLHTVGFVNRNPVCISIHKATVKGKVILFYYPTSQLVDWRMIEKWRKENLPGIKNTDAMNFHNILY